MSSPSPLDVAAALRVLSSAGVFYVEHHSAEFLSLASAAARLDVGTEWVRAHLNEFPGWFRLPSVTGGLGQCCGEIRIPMADVRSFAMRRQAARSSQDSKKSVADGVSNGSVSRKENPQKAGRPWRPWVAGASG